MDYSKPEGVTVPVIDGIWDVESASNQYTGDNAFYYSFKLYARRAPEPEPETPKQPEPKPETEGVAPVEVSGFGDGWLLIADVKDSEKHSGDTEPTKWEVPSWFADAGIDQYLWVDAGTTLDYAVNTGSWGA